MSGKAKKATVCMLLAALMLSCACGSSDSGDEVTTTNNSESSESQTEETTEADPLGSLRKVDFGGETYTIIARSDGSMSQLAGIELAVDEPNGELINDTIFNRNLKIEELYNCNIEVVTMPSSEVKSAVTSSVLAGDGAYNLVWTDMNSSSVMVASDTYANFYDFDDIDLTQKWWNQNATESLTVNGQCYLQLNYIPYSGMLFTHCIYYNKRLTDVYCDEDLYGLVRDGKWTLDKFLEITANGTADLNGDTVYDENDQYGFIASFGSTGIFTYSCDQDMVSVTDDGVAQIDIVTDKMQTIVEKVNQLCYQDNRAYVNDTSYEPDMAKMFGNGQGVFYAGFLSDAMLYLRDMKDDYGLLPFPKFDEEQEHYYTSVSGGTGMLGIPKVVADPEFTGLITEALAIESYNTVRPAVFETVMENKLLRDEDSVEMYETLLDGIKIEFAVVYHGQNSYVPFTLWNLTQKNSTDLASYASTYFKSAQASYQKYVDLWYDK